jgi:hypothetical protein
MKLFQPSIRLIVAGVVMAGGAVAAAGIAAAESDCAGASPSDTTCAPPVTIPPVVGGDNGTVGGETETRVLAETAVAPAQAPAAAPAPAAAAQPVAADALAFTGSDSAELAALGAGVLALGAAATVAARRRSKA